MRMRETVSELERNSLAKKARPPARTAWLYSALLSPQSNRANEAVRGPERSSFCC